MHVLLRSSRLYPLPFAFFPFLLIRILGPWPFASTTAKVFGFVVDVPQSSTSWKIHVRQQPTSKGYVYAVPAWDDACGDFQLPTVRHVGLLLLRCAAPLIGAGHCSASLPRFAEHPELEPELSLAGCICLPAFLRLSSVRQCSYSSGVITAAARTMMSLTASSPPSIKSDNVSADSG